MWPYDALAIALIILGAGILAGWLLCGIYARWQLKRAAITHRVEIKEGDGPMLDVTAVRRLMDLINDLQDPYSRVKTRTIWDDLGGYSGPRLGQGSEPPPCGDIENPHLISFHNEMGSCKKCGRTTFGPNERGSETIP